MAQLFSMKMLTPIQKNKNNTVLKFKKLNKDNSFHKVKKNSEKYGVNSEFFTIDKTLQFSFLYHYQKALEFIDIKGKTKILNLGINKGDEFKVIQKMLSPVEFNSKKFVGIDYSKTAIEYAQKDFKQDNIEFKCYDINKIDELNLGTFDLIISIGTLQSTSMSFNTVFMSLYQNYLRKEGAIILGFPNCRWIDGEMIYGAKAPNYNFNEMSLVLKDIHFCKKYMQQKGYRVVITGKDYLFLTARKIV
ncbi:MAG: class I SAM-dependent methyltransferase [Sulfurimonas sp.]|nr:class I SAM-dependent methyltransferase [Sulfurimonas sp.]